jgi:exodeoxyribonuclease V gamma subunit
LAGPRSESLGSPLTVHLAADPSVLADRLADLWIEPPADPFSRDLVCADSPALRRWLSQRLSTRLGARNGQDGVCAGVDFLSLEACLNRLCEADRPDGDPWRGQSLTNALLTVLERCQDQAWFEPVRRHLGQPRDRPQRRVQLARRLTGLFEGYRRWRPELVAAWGPLDPETAVWQRGLWQALVELLGTAEPDPALLEKLESTGWPGVERIALFCPDQLTDWAGQVFTRLAGHHQVDLFTRSVPSADPATAPPAGSPPGRTAGLTASFSQVHRQVGGALRDLAAVEREWDSPPPPPTALGALQAALGGRPGPPLDQAQWGDGSLVFHSSHGPDRQVDVLRQVLLELLADDPTLEPRHIAVLCPRLEAYRSWIEAGLEDDGETAWRHPGHRLRVRLADAWRSRPNPMLDLLLDFLDLAGSRAGLSQLIGLCLSPPVRTRFRITPAQADRLPGLLAEAGVRWGVNAARRSAYGLAEFAENTWQAGLNRLVLGVGLSEQDLVWHDNVLPLDQVTGDQAGLVGLLLEIAGRVRRLLDLCASPTSLAGWCDRFDQVWSSLGQVEPGQGQQLQEARSLLARLRRVPSGAGAPSAPSDAPVDALSDAPARSDRGGADRAADPGRSGPDRTADPGRSEAPGPLFDLAEAKAVLDGLLADQSGRDRLLTGDLTVAAPGDLRHVPHRVVCWLGLDADCFPRAPRLDGDDLLADWGRPAQAQPTLIDRQVFFDSLLDAGQRFIVIYRGRDPRDNRPVNPPTPVRDLLDLAQAWSGRDCGPDLVRSHPAQDLRLAGADGSARPTFDPAPPRPPRARSVEPPARPALGPPAGPPVVQLGDLAAALGQPAAYYLRQRAGLTPSALTAAASRPEATADELPLELDPLARWQITDRLLRGLLDGHPAEALLAAEWRRGALPPRDLGRQTLDRCWAEASAVAGRAAPWRQAAVEWQAVDLKLTQARLIGQLASRDSVLVAVQASRLQARHQLALWIDLLGLRAARPERAWRAVLVARDGLIELRAPAAETARAELERLTELRRRAGAEVLPLPGGTAAAWAWFQARGRPVDHDSLRRRWSQEHERDPAWRLVRPDPGQLWSEPPRPSDQEWAARPLSQTTSRFEALAEAVYLPLTRAGGRR